MGDAAPMERTCVCQGPFRGQTMRPCASCALPVAVQVVFRPFSVCCVGQTELRNMLRRWHVLRALLTLNARCQAHLPQTIRVIERCRAGCREFPNKLGPARSNSVKRAPERMPLHTWWLVRSASHGCVLRDSCLAELRSPLSALLCCAHLSLLLHRRVNLCLVLCGLVLASCGTSVA